MESPLHRRRMLQLASSGFLAWGLAPLVGGCSRRGIPGEQMQAGDLEDAWRHAQADRRPLLVLLADPSRPEERGIQWSAYFDLASDEALAELSRCELAFAVPEQVYAALPWIALGESELPQALLVEPDGRTTAHVPAIRPEPTWQALVEAGAPEPLRDWLVRFETSVHAALASSQSLARADPGSNVREASAALRNRLRERAPAGGKWAKRFGGCGSIEFEDGSSSSLRPDAAIACGMGRHSEKSRRFLWLYSERKS